MKSKSIKLKPLPNDRFIVVTGAAGFIGSCLVRYLNEIGYQQLILVDSLGSDERWLNLVGKTFRDILSPEVFFDWLRGKENEVEAIFHLGACSSTLEQDVSYLIDNNYRYTLKLAEWALKARVRFVYASSAATYGNGSAGFSDSHELLRELKPLNPYGYSKHLFDLWALQEGVLEEIVGLKYFNVFGPNEWHKGRMASAVLKFFEAIQKEGKVSLFASSDPEKFKDGEQTRDFLYVKDAVRITASFLENRAGGIFNVGTGRGETWKTLAESTFKAMGKEENISFIPMPDDLVGKYQNYTQAETGKLSALLKEKAKTMPLEKAVFDYVSYHLLPRASY